MTNPIITADQARTWVGHLEAANMTGNPEYHALTTILALHEKVTELEKERSALEVETDYRVVNPETNGGKYETRRYERLASPWRDAGPTRQG